MVFYRIYQFIVMIPLLVLSTIITALITILGGILGFGKWAGNYPPHYWAKFICWITLVRVTIKGKEKISKGQSYVFVANHQGAYDIFSIYGYLGHQFRWMMKKSLEKIPLVGYACRVTGHIYVDRSTPAAVRNTMETAEKRLAGGMSVVVFPEGARTPDGKIHKFKRGAFILATEFNLPVVPMTIEGSYEVMPRRAKLPRPGHITLTVHDPIYAPAEGHDLQKLMDDAEKAVKEI